jgi:hypothetical protein
MAACFKKSQPTALVSSPTSRLYGFEQRREKLDGQMVREVGEKIGDHNFHPA